MAAPRRGRLSDGARPGLLKVALPVKGRLREPSFHLLEDAGLGPEQEEVRLRVSQLSAALERLRQTHGAFLKQSADNYALQRRGADLEIRHIEF